ncbi:MAG: prepilin peptidase [Candidatus Sungiibacteriota bacterium]
MIVFLPPVFSILFLASVIGLVIGSFLNVVILRGARGEGLGGPPRRGSPWARIAHLGGRSRCDHCGAKLRARELIPVISFLWQKARCRSCGTVLSWQYPLVEAGTALAFLFLAWRFFPAVAGGFGQAFLFFLAFPAMAALIVLVVSDFKFQILPDGATAILLLFGIAAGIVRGALLIDTIAALTFALFFAALWFFSRGRWMGFGDAKLILATALAVGFPASFAAFLFSFWLGGIVGVVLLSLGKKGLQSRIPFGPFIIAGTLVAWFFADSFFAFTGLDLLL